MKNLASTNRTFWSAPSCSTDPCNFNAKQSRWSHFLDNLIAYSFHFTEFVLRLQKFHGSDSRESTETDWGAIRASEYLPSVACQSLIQSSNTHTSSRLSNVPIASPSTRNPSYYKGNISSSSLAICTELMLNKKHKTKILLLAASFVARDSTPFSPRTISTFPKMSWSSGRRHRLVDLLHRPFQELPCTFPPPLIDLDVHGCRSCCSSADLWTWL